MASPLTGRIEPGASAGKRISALGWCRLVLRLFSLIGLLVLMVPLHYLTHAAFRHSHWPRRFLGSAASVVGAEVATVGQPHPGNVFYVANHISWIDILAMGGASGTAFIAKAELEKMAQDGRLAGYIVKA